MNHLAYLLLRCLCLNQRSCLFCRNLARLSTLLMMAVVLLRLDIRAFRIFTVTFLSILFSLELVVDLHIALFVLGAMTIHRAIFPVS